MLRISLLFLPLLGLASPGSTTAAEDIRKQLAPKDNVEACADEKVTEKKTEHESEKFDKPNGNGPFPSVVPEFSLKDPAGNAHKGEDLYKENGMLLMLTVPNLDQCERQKRWESLLKKESWPQQNVAHCVVLEDMSQQETYKDRARRSIEEKSKDGTQTLFLIDENGDVRRGFGVEQNETVILLVDSSGAVIHNESDEVEPERVSAHRIVQQVKRLAQQSESAAAATPQPEPVVAATPQSESVPAAPQSEPVAAVKPPVTDGDSARR